MTKMRKTGTTLAVLAAGAAILAAGVAMARGPGGHEAGFSNFDLDGDGQITASEFAQHKQARLTEIDADGDGFVTVEELVAHSKARMAERIEVRAAHMIDRLDADDDGKLSVEELAAMQGKGRRGPQLDEAGFPVGWDQNGDGVVTEEEFQTAFAERRGMFRKGGGHGRFGGGQHGSN